MFRTLALALACLLWLGPTPAVQAEEESSQAEAPKDAPPADAPKDAPPADAPKDAPPADAPKDTPPADAPAADAPAADAPAADAPQGAPAEAAQEAPWAPAAKHIQGLAAGLESLAVIRPEAEGTDRDLGDLEAWLLAELAANKGLKVVTPEQVSATAGVVFAITGPGLGRMAERSGAKAALFVRLILSSDGAELVLLAANHQGQIILDQAVGLPELPPPGQKDEPALVADPSQPGPTDPRAIPDAGQAKPDEGPGSAAPPAPWGDDRKREGRERFDQQRIVMAPGGGPGRYRLIQAEQDLGELDLVRLVGRTDLEERLKTEIDSLQFMRSLGMGLTLAGFTVAGLAMPLFHSSDRAGEYTGGIVTGLGAAAGTAGVVLWLIYGSEAVTAGGPNPVRHLLSEDEAEQLVRAYNDTLRRELGLEPAAGPRAGSGVSFDWFVGPTAGGAAACALVRF